MMSKNSTIRSFIALSVEPIDELVSLLTQLGYVGRDVRVASVGKLHVTLRFFGDVELVPALTKTVQNVTNQFSQSTITLGQVEAFPNRADGEVLWVSLSPTKYLIKAAGLINLELESLGIAAETRQIRPHLTIARLRRLLSELADTSQRSLNELFASPARLGSISLTKIRLYRSVSADSPSATRTTYRII